MLMVGSVGTSVMLTAAQNNTAFAASSAAPAATVQPTGVALGTVLTTAVGNGIAPTRTCVSNDSGGCWASGRPQTPEEREARAAERASISDLLLVNRWRDATAQFQNKYDFWAIGDLMNAASRTMIQGNVMSIGNGFWVVSQWTAELAINFEPISAFGFQLDQIGAQLGQALLDPSSGVAVVPIAGVVVLLIWMFGSWRKSGGDGGQLFKRIGGLIAILAVFAIMVNGASNSTQTAATYNPGVGSPGWLITGANEALTTAATAPVGAVLAATRSQQAAALSTSGNNLCAQTVNHYDNRFRQAFNANVLTSPRIALTQTMDGMWRTTGLEVWKATQFGANKHADNSYCRLLDFWTQNPAVNASSFTQATGIPATGRGANAQLVWTAGSSEQVQRMMVGWAACEPTNRASGTWQLRPEWAQLADVNANECNLWWNKLDSGKDFDGGFSVGYSMADIEKKTANIPAASQQGVQDYLASLNGANSAGALFPLMLYALSAFLMMFVFFGVAIAVVIAKFFVILGTLTIFPILLLALFRGDGFESTAAAGKQFIGSMVFAAFALVMLSVIVLLTNIMVGFGNDSFGRGTVMALAWAGAAPIIALVALNLVFKKVLKMPSPFSAKGGMAYGLAAGAAGGAVGGFLGGRMARSAIERAGSQAMRGAGSSALNKATGGRFGSTAAARRMFGGRDMPFGGGMLGGAGAGGVGAAAGAGAGGAASRIAGGGGQGGTRQERRAAGRREKMEARVYAAQQRSERPGVSGRGTGLGAGGSRDFTNPADSTLRARARDASDRFTSAASERGAAMWNGAKARATTLRHPIQHLRGDDLREGFKQEDGSFDEVGFRLARRDRIKSEMKDAAKVGAVVAGGVMTAGSSWAIGAAAVGATYATGKAAGATLRATRTASQTGQRRMESYRNHVQEQAAAQAEAERAARTQQRADTRRPTTPAPARQPRPRARGAAAPRATGRPTSSPNTRPPTA